MVTLLSVSLLHADDVDDLKKSSLANVNALIILTTQDMLTSGRYTFNSGATLHVLNIPYTYHFDPLFSDFNLFVNGSAGYSKLKADIDFDFPQTDELIYETVALRLGGGVRYASSFGVNFLVGFDFIYSHIRNTYNYNNPSIASEYQPLFDRVFANQDSSAYTYEFFWQAGYTPVWAEWKPYAIFGVNYFDTKQELNFSALSSFHSSSLGSRLKLGFETPQLVHIDQTGLSLEFYLSANTFGGGVRDTLEFDGYGSSAALLHFYLNSLLPLVERIDLMAERVDGDGIEGYNVGLSGGFSF